ncbi:hypothetical protein BLA6992_00006 [Burkholderia lata]|nr:hypothetical protein BLA6992_00006 [Burkholderia lata]
MVADEVMQQHHRVPASARCFGDHEAQERRLGQIHPVAPRMDVGRQLLRGARAVVERQLGHVEVRAPQHDLYRRTQTFPQHGRAEDVVPLDEAIHRLKIAIERGAIGKGQMRAQQIGVSLRAEDMMKQDAVLQR